VENPKEVVDCDEEEDFLLKKILLLTYICVGSTCFSSSE